VNLASTTRAASRGDAKDALWRTAYLVLFAVAAVTCVAGFLFLERDLPAAEEASAPATSSVPPETAALPPPTVVYEDKGHLEIVRHVTIEEVPVAREVVPEPPVHVKFGASSTLEFRLRNKHGSPLRLVKPSASVLHGTDAPLEVPVVDAGNGVYDVPFAPGAPGRFEVVLNDGGVPVATKKVGVVGVAGAPGDGTDPDFLSVDPRSPRMRTSGRFSLR
jgi:hypothetical protein